MNRQKDILNQLAKDHGISIGQAEEIWNLLVDKTAVEIATNKKDDNGLYDETKFNVIHIDNFGKFLPDKRNIANANKWIKKKKDETIRK